MLDHENIGCQDIMRFSAKTEIQYHISILLRRLTRKYKIWQIHLNSRQIKSFELPTLNYILYFGSYSFNINCSS